MSNSNFLNDGSFAEVEEYATHRALTAKRDASAALLQVEQDKHNAIERELTNTYKCPMPRAIVRFPETVHALINQSETALAEGSLKDDLRSKSSDRIQPKVAFFEDAMMFAEMAINAAKKFTQENKND